MTPSSWHVHKRPMRTNLIIQILGGTAMLAILSFLNISITPASARVSRTIAKAATIPCQHALIPAYFYPGKSWSLSIATASAGDTMIMNPGSGPGSVLDSNYASTVAQAQAAGVRVLGYVHTSYGARDASLVKREINAYKEWYHVDGIFLDEVASRADMLPYYQTVANTIRAFPGSFIVLNPGVVPDEGYMNVGDQVVTFEGTYRTYSKTFAFPAWTQNYSANRFVNLVYGVPSRSLSNAFAISRTLNAANIYFTDDTFPNPWDRLPTFWSSETTTLARSCSK